MSPTKSIEWVGFDDVKSMEYKANYIKDNNLGGGMLWSLDMVKFTILNPLRKKILFF